MNYLIIGTGGVGGCIAGFLALAGKDVTCIARGKHLEAIRRQGLHLKSDLKEEHFLRVKACTAEEYRGKADVILVCVKGYSIDSIRPVLERAATPHTLVIPILNVYGTGPALVAWCLLSRCSTGVSTSWASYRAKGKSARWAASSAWCSVRVRSSR